MLGLFSHSLKVRKLIQLTQTRAVPGQGECNQLQSEVVEKVSYKDTFTKCVMCV